MDFQVWVFLHPGYHLQLDLFRRNGEGQHGILRSDSVMTEGFRGGSYDLLVPLSVNSDVKEN